MNRDEVDGNMESWGQNNEPMNPFSDPIPFIIFDFWTSQLLITVPSLYLPVVLRKVWRYPRGNQKSEDRPYNNQQEMLKTTNNYRGNLNSTKYRGWTQVLLKGNQFLLH
jgi:hypothetical protein